MPVSRGGCVTLSPCPTCPLVPSAAPPPPRAHFAFCISLWRPRREAPGKRPGSARGLLRLPGSAGALRPPPGGRGKQGSSRGLRQNLGLPPRQLPLGDARPSAISPPLSRPVLASGSPVFSSENFILVAYVG